MEYNFSEFNPHEVFPENPVGLNNTGLEINQDNLASDPFLSTENLFNGLLNKDKGIGNKYEDWKSNAQSVLMQQNVIKHIIEIEKSPKKVKDFWIEYDEKIDSLLKKVKDREKAEKIYYEFKGMKRSIIGSLATINFFESEGFEFDYPSVEEDMKQKCDLKFQKSLKDGKIFILAVQLKSMHLLDLKKDEIQKIINKLILTDDKELEGKDKIDFDILKQHCNSNSTENHIPLFVNMPISQEVRTGGRRHANTTKLVSDNGEINSVMQKSLEVKWDEKKREIGLDKI